MKRFHRNLLAASGLALTLQAIAAFAQDFPRQSSPSVQDGVAAPFVGQWSVSHPDDDNTIVSTELITCDNPSRIKARGEQQIAISRRDDIEAPVVLDLTEFAGRTSWLPVKSGLSALAVWVDENSFYRYEVSAEGAANWDWPFLYRRCP